MDRFERNLTELETQARQLIPRPFTFTVSPSRRDLYNIMSSSVSDAFQGALNERDQRARKTALLTAFNLRDMSIQALNSNILLKRIYVNLSKMAFLTRLSRDLILRCLIEIPYPDLPLLLRVCRKINEYINSSEFWSMKTRYELGVEIDISKFRKKPRFQYIYHLGFNKIFHPGFEAYFSPLEILMTAAQNGDRELLDYICHYLVKYPTLLTKRPEVVTELADLGYVDHAYDLTVSLSLPSPDITAFFSMNLTMKNL